MRSDKQEPASDPLSDEQRLALLEKQRRFDRLLLWAMTALLAMILASWLTWGLMGMFGEQQEAIGNSQIEALQDRLTALQAQLASQELQLARLDAMAQDEPAPAAAGDDKRESLQRLARILTAQEQSFQRSLAALRTGMRDLAGMIAGSRSWLADYNEALDKTLAESQARERELQQWASDGGAATTR